MEEGEEFKKYVVDRDKECEEFSVVSEQFHLTMPNSEIMKIYRIQNKPLWRKYKSCCEEMKTCNKGILNEKLLFHGTRNTSPEKIYKGDTGFDERYSRDGMWGYGNYFAQNSKYSDSYAYCNGEMREMFGAHVLTGISSTEPDDTRKMAQVRTDEETGVRTDEETGVRTDEEIGVRTDEETGVQTDEETGVRTDEETRVTRRYDSVTGHTDGTRVFITYDNIHAYPSYLIVYKHL